MTTTINQVEAQKRPRPSFHFWLIAAMCFFIFGGFGITYLQPMTSGSMLPVPPIVHLHGIVFFSWMLLLLTQSLLVNVKNMKLHRSLGTFGIALATALILIGSLLSVMSAAASPTDAPFYYDLNYLSYAAVLIFTTLFILAIRQVRKPDNHRRLILFATIPLLPPGINRLYAELFNLDYLPVLATYLTMDVFVIALLLYDWKAKHRILAVSMLGAAFIFGQQILHIPVSHSAAFADFSDMLNALVYYR